LEKGERYLPTSPQTLPGEQASSGVYEIDTSDWKIYRVNWDTWLPKFGYVHDPSVTDYPDFKIRYPKDWELQEVKWGLEIYSFSLAKYGGSLYSGVEALPEGEFKIEIYFQGERTGSEIPCDFWYNWYKTEGSQELKRYQISVDGVKGIVVETRTQKNVCVIKDNKEIVIRSYPINSPNYSKIFETIISSIRWM
jgi:hypothetical protein